MALKEKVGKRKGQKGIISALNKEPTKKTLKGYIKVPKKIITQEQDPALFELKLFMQLNNVNKSTQGVVLSRLKHNKSCEFRLPSKIEESYINLFMNEKTPHELFGDCLNEYNEVQEIKKNLIK